MDAGCDRVHGAAIFAGGRDGPFAFATVLPRCFGATLLILFRKWLRHSCTPLLREYGRATGQVVGCQAAVFCILLVVNGLAVKNISERLVRVLQKSRQNFLNRRRRQRPMICCLGALAKPGRGSRTSRRRIGRMAEDQHVRDDWTFPKSDAKRVSAFASNYPG